MSRKNHRKQRRQKQRLESRRVYQLDAELTLSEKRLIDLERVARQRPDLSDTAMSLIHYFFNNKKWTHKQEWLVNKLILDSKIRTKRSTKIIDYYLYVISDGELVKIGYSHNPKSRKSEMQVGNPKPLKLLMSFKVGSRESMAKKAEGYVHNLCKTHKVRGEWFMGEAVQLVRDAKQELEVA